MDLVNVIPGHDHPVSRKKKIDEAASDISEDAPQDDKPSTLTDIDGTLPVEPSDGGTHLSSSHDDSSQDWPGFSLDSLTVIRKQLSDLTKQKCEIKESMQTLRGDVVDDLFSTMKIRQAALTGLTIARIKGNERQKCLIVLDNKELQMQSKEQDLVWLETQLVHNDARLELVHAACRELDEKISAQIEGSPSAEVYRIDLTDFSYLSTFLRQTGAVDDRITHTAPKQHVQIPEAERGAFSLFKDLPAEIRLYVWEASLPGPRILTEQSIHNETFAALATCRESRKVAQSRYMQMASPSRHFPHEATPILYVDPNIDTVVRDLTARDYTAGPLFSRDGPDFSSQCYHMLAGLSRIRHLAIAYDLLRENGGILFGPVQAACPALESLTIFPSSFRPTTAHRDLYLDIRFVELDSNLLDFISFRWDQVSERALKRKALRGVTVISTLLSHAMQYRAVFPEYIGRFGYRWNPVIKVCILAGWNDYYEAWQTQPLDGDRYSRGFRAEDGMLHDGFVESGMIGDLENGLYSRYDGLADLFRELLSC